METVLLSKAKHNRQQFDCGVEALNNYLKIMAGQQAKKDNSRTYVLEDEKQAGRIIGFYTLAMMPIELSGLPERLRKKHHNAGSGGLIARLAVDQRYKGQGFGEWLLVDALRKLLMASETVGFPVVIVAKDGAKGFYEKFGFTGFVDVEERLFITVADLRVSV